MLCFRAVPAVAPVCRITANLYSTRPEKMCPSLSDLPAAASRTNGCMALPFIAGQAVGSWPFGPSDGLVVVAVLAPKTRDASAAPGGVLLPWPESDLVLYQYYRTVVQYFEG
jgi:hypothetical protein